MNILVEKQYITEMTCGTNFSYILSDNNMFLTTEYKVLQSQTNSCFVKCMKMMFNGKVQLYYLTKGFKPFSALIPLLDPESFLTIVTNLFSDILDVKHNGFLSCQNIDIAFDKIYVDPATYKVSLVYLPLSKRIYDDVSGLENDIRTGLVKLISSIDSLNSSRTIQFAAYLSNGTMGLEDILNAAKGVGHQRIPVIEKSARKELTIVAMNAPTRIEIAVTKDNFVIGKKPDMCDGIIGFNNMISRAHCKINIKGDIFTITDLLSANGTYVNKMKLQPHQPCVIKNGDVIRLANSDFQVRIK